MGSDPGNELERRRHPSMGTDMQDARRPAERPEQHQEISRQRCVVVPGKAERIEQHREPKEAEADAGYARAGQRFAQEYACACAHPERGRVTKHDRAAGGNKLQSDAHQDGESDHVQEGNIEHDGDIAALRERQRPSADRDCEQGGGSHQGAQQQRPQRRQVLQDRLDHRPSRPPANGNGAQEQNGLVRSQ